MGSNSASDGVANVLCGAISALGTSAGATAMTRACGAGGSAASACEGLCGKLYEDTTCAGADAGACET
jgi:hypothetical protein